jgi:hypothetical protein
MAFIIILSIFKQFCRENKKEGTNKMSIGEYKETVEYH